MTLAGQAGDRGKERNGATLVLSSTYTKLAQRDKMWLPRRAGHGRLVTDAVAGVVVAGARERVFSPLVRDGPRVVDGHGLPCRKKQVLQRSEMVKTCR